MLAESMLENRVLKEVNAKVTMFKGIEPHWALLHESGLTG